MNKIHLYNSQKHIEKYGSINASKMECKTEDVVSLSFLQLLTYFSQMISGELLAERTNLYSIQKKVKSIETNSKDIKSFVGIHLLMGVFNLPQACMYLSKMSSLISLVANGIQRDLQSTFHFADNVKFLLMPETAFGEHVP